MASPERETPKARAEKSPRTVEAGKLDRDVYSVKELASAIGVHFESILAAINQGDLPAIKFGGSAGYRIRQASVLAWLERLEQRHTEEARSLAAAASR